MENLVSLPSIGKNCSEGYSKGRTRFDTQHECEVIEDLKEFVSHWRGPSICRVEIPSKKRMRFKGKYNRSMWKRGNKWMAKGYTLCTEKGCETWDMMKENKKPIELYSRYIYF